MYDWENIESFTQRFLPGQRVDLNPDWPAFRYLDQNDGHWFPRKIEKVSPQGDVIEFVVGKGKNKQTIPYAPQCLTKNCRI